LHANVDSAAGREFNVPPRPGIHLYEVEHIIPHVLLELSAEDSPVPYVGEELSERGRTVACVLQWNAYHQRAVTEIRGAHSQTTPREKSSDVAVAINEAIDEVMIGGRPRNVLLQHYLKPGTDTFSQPSLRADFVGNPKGLYTKPREKLLRVYRLQERALKDLV
jgi:hypothetical protein